MSQCLTCSKCDLRGADKMATYGFALCKLGKRFEFVSVLFERECASHEQADDGVVASRRKWLEKKGVIACTA